MTVQGEQAPRREPRGRPEGSLGAAIGGGCRRARRWKRCCGCCAAKRSTRCHGSWASLRRRWPGGAVRSSPADGRACRAVLRTSGTKRSGACGPRSAKSPWTTSCCSSAATPWRTAGVYDGGGRSDEPRGLALHRSSLRRGGGVPGVGGPTLHMPGGRWLERRTSAVVEGRGHCGRTRRSSSRSGPCSGRASSSAKALARCGPDGA